MTTSYAKLDHDRAAQGVVISGSSLEDAVTEQHLAIEERSARLKGYLEKLNFRQFPKFSDCIDWNKVEELVGPLLRKHLGSIK